MSENAELELDELAEIYVKRGVDQPLARQVARQLMAKDALTAHARDELGISQLTTARPVQPALTSALMFSVIRALANTMPSSLTGGGPGMMEAANRGAFDVGAKSAGLNITLPHEQYPNPYVTPELCFSFHYFALRKLHFLLRAKALVAFPGGYGTFDELFEVLTLVQTRKIKPIPVVLVGEAYWRRAIDMDFLVDEGVIDREDRDLFWFAETAQEIWNGILHWHDAGGEPLHAAT